MRKLIALFCLLAAPASADFCTDLWFTRNLIMDRAGYCFGSALVQATFDNASCIGKSVSLDPAWSNFVAQIQAQEREFSCKVNTGQRFLDLDDAYIRRQLVHLPMRDSLESACLNWIGPAYPLHAGAGPEWGAVGQITPGTKVSFAHWPLGDWTYVTVRNQDWGILSGGWLGGDTSGYCTDWAG